MPSSATRWASGPRRAAPSSMEYSVCTCRWTKESRAPVVITVSELLHRGRLAMPSAGLSGLGGDSRRPSGEGRQPTRPPGRVWHHAPTAGIGDTGTMPIDLDAINADRDRIREEYL